MLSHFFYRDLLYYLGMLIPDSLDSATLKEAVTWLRTWFIDSMTVCQSDDEFLDEIRLSVEFRQACNDGQDDLANSVRDRISIVRIIRSGSSVIFKEVVIKGSGEVFPVFFKEASGGKKLVMNSILKCFKINLSLIKTARSTCM